MAPTSTLGSSRRRPGGEGSVGRPGATARSTPTPSGRREDAELVTAFVLLGSAAVLGLYLHVAPGPTVVDRMLAGLDPTRHHGAFVVGLTRLGSAPVVLAGSVAGCLAAARRRPARALALLVGPALAVGAGDGVVKPIVDRRLDGVLTYPSGTVAAVAALAAVAVLATPDAWRWLAGALGATATVMTSLSAVALGWHFPTDAAGGAALGVGAVLLADCAARRWLWPERGRRSVPGGGHALGPRPRARDSASR